MPLPRPIVLLSLFLVGCGTPVADGRPAQPSPPEPPANPAPTPLFPTLDQVPPALRMPVDAVVTSDAAGTWLVGGQPRFLVGTQLTNTLKGSQAPTAGYPRELAWIYDDAMTWESAQRLGFDSLGFFTNDAWVAGRKPDYRSFHHAPADEAFLAGWLQATRLPLYVDFTCFPWTHGTLASKRGGQPPEALNAGGSDGERNHWVPYSATHPAGIELYRTMWRAGVRQVQALGVKPLYYELFNEPGYDDPSQHNRGLFASELQRRFTDIAALNRAWGADFADFAAAASGDRTRHRGLAVAWGRFMERCFADLVAEGVRTVRALDPAARVTVQVMGGTRWRELPLTNANLQLIAPLLDVISTPTGGGISTTGGLDTLPARAVSAPDPAIEGILMRRFISAIAAGKPVVDGEAYAQGDLASTVAMLWLECARGGNAAYLFEWGRRAWDPEWLPAGSEAGGRRIAAKFPWYLLNPYSTPTEVLTAPMRFKREFARAGAAFVSRDRGVKPALALLLSTPTERYAAAAGTLDHHQVRVYAGALEFGHHAWDVLTEEQLAAGGAAPYRVIVAPAIRNVLATTPERLRGFLAGGGTLIAGGGVLGEDEDGQTLDRSGLVDLDPGRGEAAEAPIVSALPAPPGLAGPITGRPARGLVAGPAWRVLARAGEAPAVLEREQGSGRVVYVGARLDAYPLASLLGAVLGRIGVVPACSLLRDADGELAVNVEVHASRLGTGSSWLLFNGNRTAQLVRLRPASGSVAEAADLIAGRRLPIVDGAALVALPPGGVVVVACDAGHADLPAVAAAQLRAEVAAQAAAVATERARLRSAAVVDDPPVDAARVTCLDLRPFANRHFLDGVAGDGQGGWTDQGAGNSLIGIPFGRQTWRGVPFDIIRFDENANRTCIVLASPRMAGGAPQVEAIPVGARVGALHLLLASAWSTPGALAARMTVRYADGGTCVVPIRCGVEVGDWWLDSGVNRAATMDALVAFRTVDNRGLFSWRWRNPEPQRAVASLDLASAGQDPIAIVVAITREDPGPQLVVLGDALPAAWTVAGWNDVQATWAEGRLALAPGRRGWGGATVGGPAVILPEGLDAGARLEMRIAGVGAGGGEVPLPAFQVRLRGRLANGTEVAGGYTALAPAPDQHAVRRRPWLPLASVLPTGCRSITHLDIQFVGDVPPANGVVMWDVRIVK